MADVKQVIVMRTDLNMRKGKMVAQGAHASMAFLTRRLDPTCCYHPTASTVRLSEVEQKWLDESFVKICVGVDSEAELLILRSDAKIRNIEAHLVTDSGLTEFKGTPTHTCLAIGPDYSERIDPLTSHLRLL